MYIYICYTYLIYYIYGDQRVSCSPCLNLIDFF